MTTAGLYKKEKEEKPDEFRLSPKGSLRRRFHRAPRTWRGKAAASSTLSHRRVAGGMDLEFDFGVDRFYIVFYIMQFRLRKDGGYAYVCRGPVRREAIACFPRRHR